MICKGCGKMLIEASEVEAGLCLSCAALELANSLVQSFYSLSQVSPLEVKIEFVDNIYDREMELASCEEEKKEIVSGKAFIEEVNGTIFLPEFVSQEPYILISKKAISKDFLFVGTVIHELTHINDFWAFAMQNNITVWRKINCHPDFEPLYYWTEYHARHNGYKALREFTFHRNPVSKEKQIEHIRDIETPYQLKLLIDSLEKYQNDANLYMYSLVQFLGRYSVWEDCFPNYFNISNLPFALVNTFKNKITDLYSFFTSHNDFESISSSYNEIKKLIYAFL